MIDLPGDCALIAVAAATHLRAHDVHCEVIAATYRENPVHRHIIVAFEFEGRVRVYDKTGSVTLPKELRMSDSPSKIARAWQRNPSSEFPFKILAAESY